MTFTQLSLRQKGFTIVELLVVIIVIGIIAGIIVVSYSAVTQSARKQAVKTDAQAIASQINKYKSDKGSYPSDLSEIQIPSGVTSTFQYAYNETAGSYCVTASVKGASAFVKSGSVVASEGGCPGHGINGEVAITNLASNPSGEVGSTGVSGYNSSPISRVTGGAPSGNYLFSTTTNSSTVSQGIIHTITTSAKPNQVYTCSLALRGTAGAVIVSGRPATAAGGYISENLGTKTYTLTSNWQRLALTFTTPDTTGILRIQVRTQAPIVNVNIQTDAIMCVEGDQEYQYADGSLDNWMWSGQEHLSSSYGPAL